MTTLMLRHIPRTYDSEDVLDLLDSHGFVGHYDFVYLSRNVKSASALHHAFVNFVSPELASLAFKAFDKFDGWKGKSSKACEVRWSRTQGFAENVEAARHRPVWKNVAGNFTPCVFQHGVRVQFPRFV
jgi:hypothetical protein